MIYADLLMFLGFAAIGIGLVVARRCFTKGNVRSTRPRVKYVLTVKAQPLSSPDEVRRFTRSK